MTIAIMMTVTTTVDASRSGSGPLSPRFLQARPDKEDYDHGQDDVGSDSAAIAAGCGTSLLCGPHVDEEPVLRHGFTSFRFRCKSDGAVTLSWPR